VPPLPPNTPNISNHNPPTKADLALEAFTTLISNTLHPTVSSDDLTEYEFYISHPSHIPLVVSGATDLSKVPHEFLEYLSKTDDALFDQVDTQTLYNDHGGLGLMTMDERAEREVEEYREYLEVLPEGLTVLEEDLVEKTRYKRYRQWVRGKSLFKQKLVVGGEVV
jgi:hypothetical protein